jgi:methylmalonyl-CoA mutase, C-terminal domain
LALLSAGGWIIPEEEIPALTEVGIKKLFTPGTPVEEAVKWKENIKMSSA